MMLTFNSTDGLSCLKVKMIEVEKRFPSISLILEINDRGFSGILSEVWVEWKNIEDYIQNSKDYAYKDTFIHSFKSMSPKEMEISLQKINPEICNLNYELNKITYGKNPVQLKGSFDFSIAKLEELRTYLLELRERFN